MALAIYLRASRRCGTPLRGVTICSHPPGSLFFTISQSSPAAARFGRQRAVSGPNDSSNVLETIGSLVDKSLLRMYETTDGEVRFVMLETLREFAAEQLHLDP